ncbi:hypothetical protein LINPERPRIM_LOCUS16865 [Linum perenne]
MLLRTSSSSGIKGSVFSVRSETPLVRDFDNPTSNFRHHHHSPSHLSFPPQLKRGGGFRRAWSESNIDRFVAPSSCDSKQLQSLTPRRYPPRKRMLHSAPSFSIFTTGEEEDEKEEEMKDVSLVRTVTIGENIESVDFSFGKRRENSMGLIVEEGEETEQREGDQMQVKDEGDGDDRMGLIFNGVMTNLGVVGDEKEPMYLAAGLGFDSIDFQAATTGEAAPLLDFDESGDLEEYYRKMLDQFPSHPLFLRNYAHLLQSKGDLHSAEEYYQRAILVEPEDGEILMHYAKLVWELYHDRDRAKGFFERATQAAPNDSNVLAAYASFLWEISGVDEAENTLQMEQFEYSSVKLPVQVARPGNNEVNAEEYYKRMVEENPNSALVLRNYAQFLYQSKGDLQGAEEYYSRAILADPGDGEIMSQYAKLVWEVHHDQEKASSYFERSAQASPADSQVLAAYASFLWETEEDDDEETDPSGQFLGSTGCEGAMVGAAN